MHQANVNSNQTWQRKTSSSIKQGKCYHKKTKNLKNMKPASHQTGLSEIVRERKRIRTFKKPKREF